MRAELLVAGDVSGQFASSVGSSSVLLAMILAGCWQAARAAWLGDGTVGWLCTSFLRVTVRKRETSSLVCTRPSSIRSATVVRERVCSWCWLWWRSHAEACQKLFVGFVVSAKWIMRLVGRLLAVVQSTHVREAISPTVVAWWVSRYLILLDS